MKKLVFIFLLMILSIAACGQTVTIEEFDKLKEEKEGLVKDLEKKTKDLKKVKESLAEANKVKNEQANTIKKLNQQLQPYLREEQIKSEQAKIEQEIGNYTSDYKLTDLIRNINDVNGKLIKFSGIVGENKVEGLDVIMIVAQNNDWRKTVVLKMALSKKQKQPTKGDKVTVYGKLDGLTEIFDREGTITMRPCIRVDKLEIHK